MGAFCIAGVGLGVLHDGVGWMRPCSNIIHSRSNTYISRQWLTRGANMKYDNTFSAMSDYCQFSDVSGKLWRIISAR